MPFPIFTFSEFRVKSAALPRKLLICSNLMAGDEIGSFAGGIPSGPWTWRGPLGNQEVRVQPAIVHVPHSKSAGLKD
jgi:hypothetical protein